MLSEILCKINCTLTKLCRRKSEAEGPVIRPIKNRAYWY